VYVTDTANNRIQGWFEVSGGVPTYLWGIAGRGPGYVTRPYGVALDPSGNLYVADTEDSRIEKFGSAGGFVGQYAYVSPNSGFAAPSGGQGAFNLPQGVAYDSKRNQIWVADTANNRVQELTATPSTINATDGTSSSFVAQYTGFSSPEGIAADANGNVYVADTANNRIQKFNGTGWSTVGGSTFSAPRGVAVDNQSGDLYVADSANNQVQRLASGSWSTVGGTTFSNPGGVFVDGARRLYVADTGNDQLQRVDLANTTAGWDRWGNDDITPGDFIGPASVTGDSNGNLFVTDTFNNRIQKFTVTMPTATTPDFALSASPGLLTIVRGGAGASTSVAIAPSNGFGGQVTLSIAGVPTGVTVSPIPPVTVGPDATGNYPPVSFTFTASSTAKIGSSTVTITGASGGLVKSTTVTLQVKRK
jgi:tripartite motif-containing protein 71